MSNIIRDSYWKDFFKTYLMSNVYWYIPKGYSIKKENFELIKKQLEILHKYRNKKWNKDLQTSIREDLKNSNLFSPKAEDQKEDDKNAIVRVMKVIASTLGLAWVKDNENLSITQIGEKLLQNKDYTNIIENQIKRFQFNKYTAKDNIKIIPVLYLAKILLKLKDKYITKDEYCLFISKKLNIEDIDKSVEEIEKYRLLKDKDKNKIKEYLKNEKIKNIKNNRRTSILNTIEKESSYAINFFCSSNLFYFSDSKILILNEKELKSFIKTNEKISVWIDFKEKKDWFYYYGNYDADKSSAEFALDYYTDISDIDKAVSTFSDYKNKKIKLPDNIKNISEEDFKSVLVDEKILEDFLERHIEELEKGLKLVGRQYPTISGPIDLLAKDNNGRFVVIELKKNRVSDKVIGQVSRYVSFLEDEGHRDIRTIIVGKNIDNNIKLSIKQLKCETVLYSFDYKVNFTRVY